MKIALIQFKPKFLDLAENLDRAVALLEDVTADIAVFPELFLSGYTFASVDQAKTCALPYREFPELEHLLSISQKKTMAICGGYAELDGSDLYNSIMF